MHPNLNLPEKTYFTPDEIAERWECGVDQVWNYIESGLLIPAMSMQGLHGRLWRGPKPGHKSTSQLVEDGAVASGMFYILNYTQLPRVLDEDIGPCIRLNGAILGFRNEDHEDWFEPVYPGSFSLTDDNLVVTRLERDRFERLCAAKEAAPASGDLSRVIGDEGFQHLEVEWQRALSNIEADPAVSLTAACAILEGLFLELITRMNLELPTKRTVKPLWAAVQAGLGLRPDDKLDPDVKKILSGMTAVVDGIGSFRTHSGSAHGGGELRYAVSPRHARLTVNAAHSLALFVIETWRDRGAHAQ